MKCYIAIFCSLCLSIFGNAQGCGTEPTEDQDTYMRGFMPQMRSFDGVMTRGVMDIPIKAHVVRRSNRTGGISKAELNAAIKQVNDFYVAANMRFILLDKINYISSDSYYNFNAKYENSLCGQHDVRKVINIYFFNSVSSEGHPLCGYAYFPPSADRIIMANDCVKNGTTLAHEIGHYFMLYHTHGKTNTGTTDELVNQSNCRTAGDLICDTAADPNLSGKIGFNCSYLGRNKDRLGQSYRPDPNNIMSYSGKECREHFTTGQYTRISYAARNHRNYLRFPTNTVKPPTIKPKPKPIRPTVATTMLSGAVELELGGQDIPVSLNNNFYQCKENYYSGTNFQLFLHNQVPAYVYVISSNLSKKNDLLFPLDHQSAYIAKPTTKMAIPGDSYMFQLDEEKGRDYICVLYSKKPLNIQNIMRKMEYQSGTFTQRLYKTLGKDVVPSNRISYSSIGKLKFNAKATSEYIVPIVFEIKHI